MQGILISLHVYQQFNITLTSIPRSVRRILTSYFFDPNILLIAVIWNTPAYVLSLLQVTEIHI
jgi:hypothetical protein